MGKDTLDILKKIESGEMSIEDAEGNLAKSLEDSQAGMEILEPDEPQEQEQEKAKAIEMPAMEKKPGAYVPTRRERKLELAEKIRDWEPQAMIGLSQSWSWPWPDANWQWMWQNFGNPVYVEHSIDMTENSELQIVSYQGDIFLRGWDNPMLKINGAAFDVRAGQDDNVVRIASSTGQLQIWIPNDINRVQARSEPGDIWLSNLAADVDVYCESGDLNCQRIRGNTKAQINGGDVRLMGVEGAIDVDIVRGNGDIREIRSGDVSLKATEGNIWFSLNSVSSGQFRCEAIDGDINLLTNGDLSCEMLVEVTDGGTISPTILPWQKLLGRSESKLHGILMNGGAHIGLKSKGGRIYIQELALSSFPIPSPE